MLVVPVTAVQGVGPTAPSGSSPTVASRATAGRHLGLTDGEQIEVREGLTEGEQVLQFVPVPDDEIVEGGDGYAMYGPGG